VVGKQTVHRMLGTRVAVLAGDFMFAQSSWYLANLDNLEVIKLISQVWPLLSLWLSSNFISMPPALKCVTYVGTVLEVSNCITFRSDLWQIFVFSMLLDQLKTIFLCWYMIAGSKLEIRKV
jgi:hypothetical protein